MKFYWACLVTSASTHIIVCLTETNATLQAMPKLGPRAKTSPALLAREKQQAKTAKTEQAKQKKQQQQQQPAAKASNKYSSSAKPPKTADLPIHIPDQVPLCESCEQPYGSNEKDALPEQRPLKWRSFNLKQIQQDIVG